MTIKKSRVRSSLSQQYVSIPSTASNSNTSHELSKVDQKSKPKQRVRSTVAVTANPLDPITYARRRKTCGSTLTQHPSPTELTNKVQVHVTVNSISHIPKLVIQTKPESEKSNPLPGVKDEAIRKNTTRSNSFMADSKNDSKIGLSCAPPSISTEIPKNCPDDEAAAEEDRVWTPGKPIRLAYITWNMAGRPPDVQQLSTSCIFPNAHIIVVSTQENGPYVGTNDSQKNFEDIVEKICLKNLYVKIGVERLWATNIIILARKRDFAHHVADIERAKVPCGFLGLAGNKGAVAVAFKVLLKQGKKKVHENATLSSGFGSARTIHVDPPEVSPPRVLPISPLQYSPRSDNDDPVFISFLCINAHFAPHQNAVEKRNNGYHRVMQELRVGSKPKAVLRRRFSDDSGSPGTEYTSSNSSKYSFSLSSVSRNEASGRSFNDSMLTRNVSNEFDVTFFGGDLNYRIDGTFNGILDVVNNRVLRAALSLNDQLNNEKLRGKIFQGFKEGKLEFRPTFKYKIQKDNFHETQSEYKHNRGNKGRLPAYCDRVLYKVSDNSQVSDVTCCIYTDVQGVTTSDHRPVVGLFDLFTRSNVH